MKRQHVIGLATAIALGALTPLTFAEGEGQAPEVDEPTQGEQGEQGMQGQQGEQAPQDEQGLEGQQGQQGLEGQQGQEGQQATQGVQGQQGDAFSQLRTVGLKNLDDQQIRDTQQKLKDIGYYKGEVDGIVGPLTLSAITRFFGDQARLAAQGKVSKQAMTAFDIDISERQLVGGQEGDTPKREQGVQGEQGKQGQQPQTEQPETQQPETQQPETQQPETEQSPSDIPQPEEGMDAEDEVPAPEPQPEP